jgi:predicted AAA+ superfamily ATPase
MQITRAIEQRFFNKIQAGKVIILLGARRVGKSAFLNIIKTKINEPILSLNGDDHLSHALLEIQSTSNYMRMLGKTRFLIIDEAQEIHKYRTKIKAHVLTRFLS